MMRKIPSDTTFFAGASITLLQIKIKQASVQEMLIFLDWERQSFLLASQLSGFESLDFSLWIDEKQNFWLWFYKYIAFRIDEK